jgi:hypothetical protein
LADRHIKGTSPALGLQTLTSIIEHICCDCHLYRQISDQRGVYCISYMKVTSVIIIVRPRITICPIPRIYID